MFHRDSLQYDRKLAFNAIFPEFVKWGKFYIVYYDYLPMWYDSESDLRPFFDNLHAFCNPNTMFGSLSMPDDWNTWYYCRSVQENEVSIRGLQWLRKNGEHYKFIFMMGESRLELGVHACRFGIHQAFDNSLAVSFVRPVHVSLSNHTFVYAIPALFHEVMMQNGGCVGCYDYRAWLLKCVQSQIDFFSKDRAFINNVFVFFSKTRYMSGDQVEGIMKSRQDMKVMTGASLRFSQIILSFRLTSLWNGDNQHRYIRPPFEGNCGIFGKCAKHIIRYLEGADFLDKTEMVKKAEEIEFLNMSKELKIQEWKQWFRHKIIEDPLQFVDHEEYCRSVKSNLDYQLPMTLVKFMNDPRYHPQGGGWSDMKEDTRDTIKESRAAAANVSEAMMKVGELVDVIKGLVVKNVDASFLSDGFDLSILIYDILVACVSQNLASLPTLTLRILKILKFPAKLLSRGVAFIMQYAPRDKHLSGEVTHHLQADGDGDPLAFIVALMTAVASSSIPRKDIMMRVQSAIRVLGSAETASKHAGKAFLKVLPKLPECAKTILAHVFPEEWMAELIDSREVREWYVEVLALDTPLTVQALGRDKPLQDKIHRLHRFGCHLMTLILEKKSKLFDYRCLGKAFSIITEQKKILDRVGVSALSRKTPYCIYLYGRPGVGKSTLTSVLAARLAPPDTPVDQILYSRSAANKYFDNYCGHAVTALEDVNADVDLEAKRELQQMISSVPFVLPMASIEEKGRYFTSEIVICSSNLKHPYCPEFIDLDALKRRRNYMVQVTVDPLYAMPDGRIDPAKAVGAGLLPYRFLRLDEMTGEPAVNAQLEDFETFYRKVAEECDTFLSNQDTTKNMIIMERIKHLQSLGLPIPPELALYIPQADPEPDNPFDDDDDEPTEEMIIDVEREPDLDDLLPPPSTAGNRRYFNVMGAALKNGVRENQSYKDVDWERRTTVLKRTGNLYEAYQAAMDLASVIEVTNCYDKSDEDYLRDLRSRGKFNLVHNVSKALFAFVGICTTVYTVYRLFKKLVKWYIKTIKSHYVKPEADLSDQIAIFKDKLDTEHFNLMCSLLQSKGHKVEGVSGSSNVKQPKVPLVKPEGVSGSSNIKQPKVPLVKPEAVHPEAITDHNANELIENRWKNATGVIQCMTCGKKCNIFATGDKNFMVPFHIFTNLQEELKHCKEGYFGVWFPGTDVKEWTKVFQFKSEHIIQLGDKKDVCIVCIPSMMSYTSSMKHFILEENLGKHARFPAMILTRRTKDREIEFHKVEATPKDRCTYDVKVATVFRQGWHYFAETKDGSCGAPLIALDPDMPRKLIGIHIAAGNDGSGLSELVTYEMVREAYDKLPSWVRTQGSKIAEGIPYTPQAGSMRIGGTLVNLGRVRSQHRPRMPEKTTLRPSILHDAVRLHTMEPSVLSPHDPRLTVPVSPLEIAINKYGTAVKELPVETMRKSVQSIIDEVTTLKKWSPPHILNLDEVLNGIPGTHAESLHITTSPGFPYCMEKPSGVQGSEWMFERDLEDHLTCVSGKLLYNYYTRLELAAEGERMGMIVVDCSKDEKLPKKKIYDIVKTRSFAILPKDMIMATRKHTLWAASVLYDNHSRFFSKVGMNPYSKDWGRMVDYLLAVGDDVWCADFLLFDGSMSSSLMGGVCDIFASMYNYENYTELKVLFDELTFRTHLCGDSLYLCQQGNPSGNALTILVNTLVHELYLRCAWQHLVPDEYQSLYYYKQYVRSCIVGDDGLVCVAKFLRDYFNLVTISRWLVQFGVSYMHASKTEKEIPYAPLQEWNFLKCGFRYENFNWYATLSEDTIYEMLNWVRKSYDDVAACIENCITALRYMSLHGRDKFSSFRQEVLNALADRGFYTPLPTFEDCMKEYDFGKEWVSDDPSPASIHIRSL